MCLNNKYLPPSNSLKYIKMLAQYIYIYIFNYITISNISEDHQYIPQRVQKLVDLYLAGWERMCCTGEKQVKHS